MLTDRQIAQKAAWIAWAMARHNWPENFSSDQFDLYVNGVRGIELHDVTAVHAEEFLNLP